MKSLYKVRLGFKSNHKVPVQVQVKPTLFFWSWSGESFKSLAQVLAEIFLQRGVGGEGGVGHVKSSGLFNVEVKDQVQIEPIKMQGKSYLIVTKQDLEQPGSLQSFHFMLQSSKVFFNRFFRQNKTL